MFIPKRLKYKKYQKGRRLNIFYKELTIKHKIRRTVCLVAEDFGRLTVKQLKALKQAITKRIKRKGRVLFNLCAFLPITKKPLEIRMGKGKGSISHFVFRIRPGKVLCEIESKYQKRAYYALFYAKARLAIRTKILL